MTDAAEMVFPPWFSIVATIVPQQDICLKFKSFRGGGGEGGGGLYSKHSHFMKNGLETLESQRTSVSSLIITWAVCWT